MTTAISFYVPNAKQQFVNGSGVPLANGKVYMYVPGTTTQKNTWVDEYQTVLNANPISLDSNGMAIIYGTGDYRQQVYDSSNNLIWDAVVSSNGSSGVALTSNNLSDLTNPTQARINIGAASGYGYAQTISISTTASLSTTQLGSFVELSGVSNYTTTFPTPVGNSAASLTVQNNSSVAQTLATPAGLFNGALGTGTNSMSLPAGSCYQFISDSVNWYAVLGGGYSVTPALADNSQKIATTAFVQNTVPAQIQSVSSSVSANALTVGFAGATLAFRNATLTTGTPTSLVVGALSLTVPSTATLGTINATQAQLILLVAYNAGTPVLCIVNASGGVNLDETTLISPTTISTGATSASTIYSSATVAANSPFRVVGYINITEATAGTWTTAPSLVQGYGGQALTSLQSLGYGQTLQNVSRSVGTTYYNTTARPIMVLLNAVNSSNLSVTINGTASTGNTSNSGQVPFTFIVPPYASYSVAGPSSLGGSGWAELR